MRKEDVRYCNLISVWESEVSYFIIIIPASHYCKKYPDITRSIQRSLRVFPAFDKGDYFRKFLWSMAE